MFRSGNSRLGPLYKVLFYVERDLHLPFLEPIFDWLQAKGVCELAFAVPPYRESYEHAPGYGLPQAELQRLAQKTRLIEDTKTFQPDVTVCADACTHLQGMGKLVFVGHGIISKGTFYTSSSIVRRENQADLICVPGPLHKEILEKSVFSPIRITGFIKSDRMFAAGAPLKPADARQQLGIPEQGKVVLYAPTYNPEMSSLYLLGEQVSELCSAGVQLIVKLHTMTDCVWKERFRILARDLPNLHYCETIDVTPAMLAADLLVTDVSSVMAEFMFLDRPVVVVDNPRLSEFPFYIPDDIEYRVRDAATTRVASLSELKIAVKHALENPGEFSERRHAVADALCFGRDGLAAQRCGQAILELLQEPVRLPDVSCTILVDWQCAPTEENVRQFEHQLYQENPDVVIQCLHSGLQQGLTGLLCCAAPLGSLQWFAEVGRGATGDYLLLLQPGSCFPTGWLHRLSLHLRWNKNAVMVQPMSWCQDLRGLIGDFLPKEVWEIAPKPLASLLFQALYGFEEPVKQDNNQCILMRPSLFTEMAMYQNQSGQQLYRYLAEVAEQSGKLRLQALDILSWPAFDLREDRLITISLPDNPLVSIIIPLFNKVELSARCIETLFQHTAADSFELVLVDNGSTDRTDELLALMPNSVQIIRNDTNKGFARACNQGAAIAHGDLLLFLNSDTELMANWLEPMLETISSDPTIGAVGSKLLFPDGTIQHAGVVIVDDCLNGDSLYAKHIWYGMPSDSAEANQQREFKALTAACLLLRKDAFQQVAGFDEGYWNGYEDVDLCFKLGQQGWRLVYQPRSVVIHHESKSGAERFAKVTDNISRLHEKWLKRVQPDVRIYPDGSVVWSGSGG